MNTILIQNNDIEKLKNELNNKTSNSHDDAYKKIVEIFKDNNPDILSLFSKPIKNGEQYTWLTDIEQLKKCELTQRNKEILEKIIQEIKNVIQYIKDPNIKNILINCLKHPDKDQSKIWSEDDIWINETNEKIVVTRWGFLPSEENAVTGGIKIELHSKFFSMLFKVVYKDEKLYNNKEIIFNIRNDRDGVRQEKGMTQSDGSFTLENVRGGSIVSVSFIDDAKIERSAHFEINDNNQKKLVLTTSCFADSESIIRKVIIPNPVRDILFNVVDKNNQSIGGRQLKFTINGLEKNYQSDQNGDICFEALEIGINIEIQDELDGNKKLGKFSVLENINSNTHILIVENNFSSDMLFTLFDENKELMPNTTLSFFINNNNNIYKTDNDGNVKITDIPIGTKVNIETEQQEKLGAFECKKVYEQNIHQLFIKPNKKDIKIIVIDEETNTHLPDFEIYFKIDNAPNITKKSDIDGIIMLKNVNIGTSIDVLYPDDNKIASIICRETENQYTVTVKKIKEIIPDMRFKVIKGKNVVEGAAIELIFNDHLPNDIKGFSDEEGNFVVNNVKLKNNVIAIAKKSFGKNKKERIVKRKFVFDNADKDYILPFKRKFPWWILLLLLLPLLLFIPINKDLIFTITDDFTKKPILFQNPVVELNKVQNKTKQINTKKTDKKGQAIFKESIYLYESLSYNPMYKAKVSCNCYTEKNEEGTYNKIKKEITLKPIVSDTSFNVKDAEDNEPMPDVEVSVVVSYGNDYKKTTTYKTDPAGNIKIIGIPICAKISVSASRKNFGKDSISGEFRKIPRTNLKLMPLKDKIKLLVYNKKTKSVLPGATVDVKMVTGKKRPITSNPFTSNINGVISVVDFDVRIDDAKETLKANGTKSGFEPDTISGIILDWVNKTKANDVTSRALYLQPEKINWQLIVKDTITNLPIAGAFVTLECDGETKTAYSNAQGYVDFADLEGDCNAKVYATHPGGTYDPSKIIQGKLEDLRNNNFVVWMYPIIQCQQSAQSGAQRGGYFPHIVGNKKRKFRINYDMDGVADQLFIYCGNNVGDSTKQFIHTTGMVSGKGQFDVDIDQCPKSTMITIRIKPNLGHTIWNYSLTCLD